MVHPWVELVPSVGVWDCHLWSGNQLFVSVGARTAEGEGWGQCLVP